MMRSIISRRNCSILWIALSCFAATWLPATGASPPVAPLPPSIPWDGGKQGSFVTALCRDKQGNLWVGCEDTGVSRWDGDSWTQFNSSNGLGDNSCYSLVCDHLGRVWAGTLNHGVSVFNGSAWKTYDQATGPLGCHVVSLACSPIDGDVWGATEAGLFRYCLRSGAWLYYTRADGLPSDQATCLAFAKDGALYVGTDCDGLAVGSPEDAFKSWHNIPGPLQPANRGRGVGLPSGLINALLVSRSGTVYCGTDAGLAWSSDRGATWTYRRGADWLDKGAGVYRSGLVDDASLCGLEVSPLFPQADEHGFAIAAAGGASGRFAAPRGFTGGQEADTTDAVSADGLPSPAPLEVYRHSRLGTFVFTAQHLVPNAPYRVRLHFAEATLDGPGRRVFDVFANGQPVLDRFDVFKAAGRKDKALVREVGAQADGLGRLTLSFQGARMQGVAAPSDLLEDYVTALSEDGSGRLWVGHRHTGLESVDERTGVREAKSTDIYSGYTKTLLVTSLGCVLVGSYGDGIQAKEWPALISAAFSKSAAASPSFPVPAAPLVQAQMRSVLAQLAQIPASTHDGQAVVETLNPDWMSQGTWIDRYGDFSAVLCNMNGGGNDQVRGYLGALADHRGWLGRNDGGGDFLRYYMTWPHTDDPRCLQNIRYGGRTEAEYDDHGEQKATTLDGPDVFCTLRVPKGRYLLSVYDVNKDGHDGNNRDRDYLVSVKVTPMTDAQFLALGSPVGTSGQEQESLYDTATGGATARIHDFWSGIWNRFYVSLAAGGPNYITVKVARNSSFNTILCGVFLDLVDEPLIFHQPVIKTAYDPPFASNSYHTDLNFPAGADVALMENLLDLRQTNPEWYNLYSRCYLLSVLRRLFDSNSTRDCMAEDIEMYESYPAYRHDLALCFNDVQLYHQRDLVSSDFCNYESPLWEQMTAKLAQDSPNIRSYIGHIAYSGAALKYALKKPIVRRLYPALMKESQ